MLARRKGQAGGEDYEQRRKYTRSVIFFFRGWVIVILVVEYGFAAKYESRFMNRRSSEGEQGDYSGRSQLSK